MTSLSGDTATTPVPKPAPPAHHGRRRRPGPATHRTRVIAALVITAIVAVAVPALWALPAVRLVLRQSFTRLLTPYTELYFTTDPAADGTTAVVPLTVVEHGPDAATLRLRVWLATPADPNGTGTGAGTTVTLRSAPGHPAETVVRLPLPSSGGAVVEVALLGTSQGLHYRLVGAAPSISTSKGTTP